MSIHYTVIDDVGLSSSDKAKLFVGIDPAKNPSPPAPGVQVDWTVLDEQNGNVTGSFNIDAKGYGKAELPVVSEPRLVKLESPEVMATNMITRPDTAGTGDGSNFVVVPDSGVAVGTKFQLVRRGGANLGAFILVGNTDMNEDCMVTITEGASPSNLHQVSRRSAKKFALDTQSTSIQVETTKPVVIIYGYKEGRRIDFVMPYA